MVGSKVLRIGPAIQDQFGIAVGIDRPRSCLLSGSHSFRLPCVWMHAGEGGIPLNFWIESDPRYRPCAVSSRGPELPPPVRGAYCALGRFTSSSCAATVPFELSSRAEEHQARGCGMRVVNDPDYWRKRAQEMRTLVKGITHSQSGRTLCRSRRTMTALLSVAEQRRRDTLNEAK